MENEKITSNTNKLKNKNLDSELTVKNKQDQTSFFNKLPKHNEEVSIIKNDNEGDEFDDSFYKAIHELEN